MAYRVFDSIQDSSLSRMTSDCSYSVLTDALPLGKGRCQKKIRRGECDLCWIMLGKKEVETTRHLGSNCPFSALAQEAVLRAAFDATMVDAEARAAGSAAAHRPAATRGALANAWRSRDRSRRNQVTYRHKAATSLRVHTGQHTPTTLAGTP